MKASARYRSWFTGSGGSVGALWRFPALTFLKAQVVAMAATAVDFAVTIILKEIAGAWYLAAVAIGALSGAVTAFFLNRNWAFRAKHGDRLNQAVKYLFVVAGSWLLNVGGVFLLCESGSMDYLSAKVCVAILVGFTYNYFLAKRFVFV